MSMSNKCVSANCFWVECMKFLSCQSHDFWKCPWDYGRFPTIYSRFSNVENVQRCSDELSAFPIVFKRQQFKHFVIQLGPLSAFFRMFSGKLNSIFSLFVIQQRTIRPLDFWVRGEIDVFSLRAWDSHKPLRVSRYNCPQTHITIHVLCDNSKVT